MRQRSYCGRTVEQFINMMRRAGRQLNGMLHSFENTVILSRAPLLPRSVFAHRRTLRSYERLDSLAENKEKLPKLLMLVREHSSAGEKPSPAISNPTKRTLHVD
jgi:hypothetical protein